MEIKRSVCPYDCPDACSLLVKVENNKVINVAGAPDQPYTAGKICPKMQHYEKTVHSPRRILRPLMRTGPKGSGQFQAVTWEKAISKIAERWQEIIAVHGAEAILPYSYAGTMGLLQRNCGNAFFNRLGASQLARTICSSAKGYGWNAVMGSTPAPCPEDVLQSDLVILWGTNALATNIHFYRRVRAAKRRDAKVWLIETHKTPTAKIADKVILVRPGSDGALALAMLYEIVQKNLIDEEFINKHVIGFNELKPLLQQYTPEKVSQITGLPAAIIKELAVLYATARAPFISLGTGLSRYGNGAMTVRTILCLPAAVGAWAKDGGGLLANLSTSSAFNLQRITREDFMEEPTRIINMNQLGSALAELTDPPVKSIYVYHANPAAVAPDQNKVIRGLSREDLFTVVHERFLTDTALLADIILPATTSVEHADIYCSYGHYFVQKVSPAISPQGQAKSNWEVFCLLAQALGFEEAYFQKSAEEMLEELISPPTSWLAEADLAKFRQCLPVELPLPKGYKTSFQTPSGKIEIYNPREKEHLPKYFEPYGGEEPYWLISFPSLYSLNSTFNEQPELVRKKGPMSLLMNPLDAQQEKLLDGQMVLACNQQGEVAFQLRTTFEVPRGVVASAGIYWLTDSPGSRSVNALTSQRLTDSAAGSTFYDNKVAVKPL